MTDYIELGSVPHGEPCAQVGTPDYPERSRKECAAFKAQIERLFPPPAGASIVIQTGQHDFGTYRWVAVRYDYSIDVANAYAYMLDENTPEFWDEKAKEDLK